MKIGILIELWFIREFMRYLKQNVRIGFYMKTYIFVLFHFNNTG